MNGRIEDPRFESLALWEVEERGEIFEVPYQEHLSNGRLFRKREVGGIVSPSKGNSIGTGKERPEGRRRQKMRLVRIRGSKTREGFFQWNGTGDDL